MADVYMKSKFYFKRGKAASWTTQNIVLGPGEPGFEIDTGKLKVGNGSTAWNDLPYITDILSLPEGTLKFLGDQASLPEVAQDGEICKFNGQFYIRSDEAWEKLSGSDSIAPIEVIKIKNAGSGSSVSLNGHSYATIEEALAQADTGDLIMLPTGFNQPISIKANKTLGLYLQNARLINQEACPLTIAKGASITISGNGIIESQKNGEPAILNNGDIILDDVTVRRTVDVENNGYYTIVNHGDMTIGGGIIYHTGTFSSMIENGYFDYTSANTKNGYNQDINNPEPTLTINDGDFASDFWIIKNDDAGHVIINGGRFCGSLLHNGIDLTINGGTFESDGFYNLRIRSFDNEYNLGKLIITGGKFIATNTTENIHLDNEVEVLITGGSFDHEVPAAYLPQGYTQKFENDYYIVTKEG